MMSDKIKIDNLEFDTTTGELIYDKSDYLSCDPPFSGVQNGRVYVKNKLTPIDAEKFQVLPSSIRERILMYPNSDYTRDVLSAPMGSVLEDTFPNFNNISYTPDCEAIIMNNDKGRPVRTTFFMN